MFQEYLLSKTTIELARYLMNDSQKLRVDIIDESYHLQELIDVIEKLKKEYTHFIQQPQSFKNPSKKARDMLVEACCYPIKSDLIDGILETWNLSMIWQIKAKRFLMDKLSMEQGEQVKATYRMEVDEGAKPNDRRSSSFNNSEYIWTVAQA